MTNCEICETKLVGGDGVYRTHLYKYHGGLIPKPNNQGIKSQARALVAQSSEIPTAQRPKADIVADVEARLARYILDAEHSESCRCSLCWARFQMDWVSKPLSEVV